MKEQIRSRVATGLDRTGLLGPVGRLRESWIAMRAGSGPARGPDGLPLPPPRMRMLVDGRNADGERFLRVGAAMAKSIRVAVAGSGPPLEELESILDFGCGCGRVARHWADLEGPAIHGCDYNDELIGWCERNLPFMRTGRNGLEPPAPFESESFDLIYALSVFSHLSEPLGEAWIAELRRLLRPGGRLLVSVLGHSCAGRLTREERSRFERGELVVERARMSGSNLCTVYHPRSYVTGKLLADFAEVEAVEAHGFEVPLMQDTYVARRAADSRTASNSLSARPRI